MVERISYPQQHSLKRIKPVLRKRHEHSFSDSGGRNGMQPPSWRKDGVKKRQKLLQEDEENGGNSFVIDRRSNLKNYYAIADRVLDQFQTTCASSNKLEETYLMGNRLIKFLSNVLPTHRHYNNKDQSLKELRIKSQNDLAHVRNQIEDIALLLDKEIYQQIMDMEGLEGDISLSSSRQRNRKRVTFALQPSSLPAHPHEQNKVLPSPSVPECFEAFNNSRNLHQVSYESTRNINDNVNHSTTKASNRHTIPAMLSEDTYRDEWEYFSDCTDNWNSGWPKSIRIDEIPDKHNITEDLFRDKQIKTQCSPDTKMNIFSDYSPQPEHVEDNLEKLLVKKESDENCERIKLLNADDSDSDTVDSWAQDSYKDESSKKVSIMSTVSQSLSNEGGHVESLENNEARLCSSNIKSPLASTNTDSVNNLICDLDSCKLTEIEDRYSECSLEEESDDELEHQEYVKKMTELEFTDDVSPCDCSGGDKTASTAETEALTTEGDSDSESIFTREGDGRLGISVREKYSPIPKNHFFDTDHDEPQNFTGDDLCTQSLSINQIQRKLDYLEFQLNEDSIEKAGSDFQRAANNSHVSTDSINKRSCLSKKLCKEEAISDPKSSYGSHAMNEPQTSSVVLDHSFMVFGEEISMLEKNQSEEVSGSHCDKNGVEVNTTQSWCTKAARIKKLKKTMAWKRRYGESSLTMK